MTIFEFAAAKSFAHYDQKKYETIGKKKFIAYLWKVVFELSCWNVQNLRMLLVFIALFRSPNFTQVGIIILKHFTLSVGEAISQTDQDGILSNERSSLAYWSLTVTVIGSSPGHEP